MNSTVDFKEISELNLDPIKQKLMHVESGEGWTQEQVNAVEVEYRRFLYLMKKFPNEQTSPAVAVDTFWHYHILDTMKYAVDCEHVFGHFLHHYPYVGMHGEDADAEHHSSGERMRELYEQTFAVSYNPGAAFCGIVRPPEQKQAGQAAFCGIVRPPQQDAAFCGIVRPPEQKAAAFCGIVRPPEQKTAAFCGIVRPPEQQASAAFCGIVRPPAQKAAAAFCGIVRPPEQDKQAATAYCALGKLPHGAKGDAIRTNAGVAAAAAH
ncbi:glycine-rich domain-containing protein [Massilia polaris]|uniref:glycine-rich domain-containing protein n=1 Tax=Massilia polaris TaxID=2728846 RepID=UPI0019806AB2|nr:hypothetical protein [Massilia polaris]